jgi:hypothetical protein
MNVERWVGHGHGQWRGCANRWAGGVRRMWGGGSQWRRIIETCSHLSFCIYVLFCVIMFKLPGGVAPMELLPSVGQNLDIYHLSLSGVLSHRWRYVLCCVVSGVGVCYAVILLYCSVVVWCWSAWCCVCCHVVCRCCNGHWVSTEHGKWVKAVRCHVNNVAAQEWLSEFVEHALLSYTAMTVSCMYLIVSIHIFLLCVVCDVICHCHMSYY